MIPRRSPYFAPNSISEILNLLKGNSKTNWTKELEKEIQKSLKLKNVMAVCSGRVGLRMILESLNLKHGMEIIMPGYTFGILTKAIEAVGLVPRPVDIDLSTFQMNPNEVSRAINKKTGAILATHLFGEPCEIKTFVKIAKDHNLILIEDCAESIGAKSDGKMTGTFGDIGIGSFNIAKPLQGITGGIIFGKNKTIISEIKRRFGDENIKYKTPWQEIIRGLIGNLLTKTPIWFLMMYAFSFKKIQSMFVKAYRSTDKNKKTLVFQPKLSTIGLSPILAKLTLSNLKNFDKRLTTRRNIRQKYIKLLSKYLEFQKVKKSDEGSVYMVVGKVKSPWKYKIDPYKLRRKLAIRGIDIAIFDEIADNVVKNTNSNTKAVYTSAISLPIYEELTTGQIRRVGKSIIQSLL